MRIALLIGSILLLFTSQNVYAVGDVGGATFLLLLGALVTYFAGCEYGWTVAERFAKKGAADEDEPKAGGSA